jgi:AcrR family transcriptional regulator
MATMSPRGAATSEPTRKSKRGKATRDRIIDVAEVLIARHGPDGFQLQQVTEHLGITPPAIYNHFKDRDDLVTHIAEKGARMLADLMRRQSGEDILDSLRRNARSYVGFLAENPAHARIILWDLARRGTTGWPGLASSNIEIRERMRQAFETATKEGAIRPIRIETYLQFLYIGSAAASVWTDYHYDYGDAETSANPEFLTQIGSPPLVKKTDAEIEQLKDEAEDLVVRLLSPNLVDTMA